MLTLYIAQKNNSSFFIQSDQIEVYDSLGYEILKMESSAVKNVAAEIKAVADAETGSSVEIIEEGEG